MNQRQADAGEIPRLPAEPTDCFISYSRANTAEVKATVERIQQSGATTWVDVSGLRPAGEWLLEIHAAIDRARSFVAFLSDAYLSSEICNAELTRAHAAGKVIIPVVLPGLTHARTPPWLRALNWISLGTTSDELDDAVTRMLEAARTDRGWADFHGNLLVRAQEWESAGRPARLLLRGQDIEVAEQELDVARRPTEAQTNELQREFVRTSRRHRTRWLRRIVAIASIVTVSSLVLSIVAVRQRSIANEQREAAERQRELAEAAEQRAEQSLSRSNFERFAAASETAPTIREAASAALASYEAGVEAELSTPQSTASLLSVLADGSRPLAQFVGRSEDQQYSGDQQGFAVSGDGSTMAYLALTGELEIVALWDASVRVSSRSLRSHGAISEQVALNYSGDRLLYGSVQLDRADDDAASVEYDATFAVYDVATSRPSTVSSGSLTLTAGIFAMAMGPGNEIAVVTEDGHITVIDTNSDPWTSTTVGEEVNFASAGYATVNFSLDANRLCASGDISGHYQIDPLQPISLSPRGECVPEPCGGSAANRIEYTGEEFSRGATCVDPQGRVINTLVSCPNGCAMARGIDSKIPIVEMPSWVDDTNVARVYAVPGPFGPQYIGIGTTGVIELWRSDFDGVLPPTAELILPDAGLVPSGQRGERRSVGDDRRLFEVTIDGDLTAQGSFAAGVPIGEPIRGHLVDDRLITVIGVDVDDDFAEDSYTATVWRLDGDAGRQLDVGSFDAYAFEGSLAAFAVDEELQLWDLDAEVQLTSIDSRESPACTIALSPSGDTLAAVSCPEEPDEPALLRLWDLSNDPAVLLDEAEMAFGGASSLSVSDNGAVAVIAHSAGQVEVRESREWTQPTALMTDVYPTNDYHEGWAAVDRTGHWIITRRHVEGIVLWLNSENGVSEVAQLLPPSDPINPPVEVEFDEVSLALTWPVGPDNPTGSFTKWDLSDTWAVGDLCSVLDPSATSPRCASAKQAPAPLEPRAAPPPLTISNDPAVPSLRVTESFTFEGMDPRAVTLAHDGALWIGGNSLTRLDPRGTTASPLPDGGPFDDLVGLGESGIAFTGFMLLASASADGDVTVHLPESADPTTSRIPDGPVTVIDGSLWVFSPDGPAILEVSPRGTIVEYGLPEEYVDADGAAISSEPDGTVVLALRFLQGDSVRTVLADVEPDGLVELIEAGDVNIQQLAVDGSGALWAYEFTSEELVRLSPDGTRHGYDTSAYGNLTSMVVDAEESAWFTTAVGVGSAAFDPATERIVVQFWPVEGASSLTDIAIDPDSGDLWVVDDDTDTLSHLTLKE